MSYALNRPINAISFEILVGMYRLGHSCIESTYVNGSGAASRSCGHNSDSIHERITAQGHNVSLIWEVGKT